MAARRLHHLIYVTITNCVLFLIVCAVALGTNWWFGTSSKGNRNEVGGVNANYGLFNGGKTKIAISGVEKKYSLKIVCSGMKGCMYSCGTTGDQRKQDLEYLLEGMDELDFILCSDPNNEEDPNANDAVKTKLKPTNSSVINADGDETEQPNGENRVFINFGLYLTTIAFLVFGMIFAIVSGVMALYNTYRTPIQPILSVSGLYIWNGISAGSVLLSMVMWLIEFTTRLRKNAAISDTLSGNHDTSETGSLGVSFWILILPILFAIANMAILKYRAWKIVKMEEKNVRVMKSDEDGKGETILF